jgi:plasmid stabilization system protein ParE
MKLLFAPRAAQDIRSIGDYLQERSPAAALLVRAAIFDSLKNVVSYPYVGHRQRTEGVRKLVTRKYPYVIYYTIDVARDEVVVLAVQHAARERDHEDA